MTVVNVKELDNKNIEHTWMFMSKTESDAEIVGYVDDYELHKENAEIEDTWYINSEDFELNGNVLVSKSITVSDWNILVDTHPEFLAFDKRKAA